MLKLHWSSLKVECDEGRQRWIPASINLKGKLLFSPPLCCIYLITISKHKVSNGA